MSEVNRVNGQCIGYIVFLIDMSPMADAGVAAQDRSVVDQHSAGTIAGRGDRGAEAGQAAAHDAGVGVVVNLLRRGLWHSYSRYCNMDPYDIIAYFLLIFDNNPWQK